MNAVPQPKPCLGPIDEASTPNRAFPPGTWDTHFHVFGPLDRFVRGFSSWRFSGGSPYDDLAVTVLANLGLTTQLAVLGLCLALGAPSVYLWLAVACFLVLGALHLRAEVRASTRREA